MTPEAAVKNAVTRMLEVSGAYFFKPFGGGYGRAGIPDVIASYHGKFLAVECKAGRGKTTVLQARELEHIRSSGGTALVINENNINDLKEYLDAN